jgi:hypothetical protein
METVGQHLRDPRFFGSTDHITMPRTEIALYPGLASFDSDIQLTLRLASILTPPSDTQWFLSLVYYLLGHNTTGMAECTVGFVEKRGTA